MKVMEEEAPPFWVDRANHHRRNRSSTWTLFFNTGFFVIVLMAFLIIVVPSVLSLARQVLNPSRWKWVNVVLVVFAIVCGFLSKRDEDQTPANTPRKSEVDISISAQPCPRQWYDEYQVNRVGNVDSVRRKRRDNVWRSYDDHYQFQRSDSGLSHCRAPTTKDDDCIDIRNIDVDTTASPALDVLPPSTTATPAPASPPPLVAVPKTVYPGYREVTDEKTIEMDTCVRSQSEVLSDLSPSPPPFTLPPSSPTTYFWQPPPPPPPPQPLRPSMVSKKKREQTYETTAYSSRFDDSTKREIKSQVQLPPPSTPSQPQFRPITNQYTKEKKEIGGKKRGGVTKSILTSFYHQRKRKKKQRRGSCDNLEEMAEAPGESIYRSKSTPDFLPPSSPPPPPSQKQSHTKVTDDNAGNGSESPLIPIPPPPPFKMTSWKFMMRGDYVKIESNNNSPRSGYSASEEDDGSPSARNAGILTPPLFCSSPDVNTKAENFIASFRAKLTLDKMNSFKLKQGTGPSPLGLFSLQS